MFKLKYVMVSNTF